MEVRRCMVGDCGTGIAPNYILALELITIGNLTHIMVMKYSKKQIRAESKTLR